jgi:hypothetical protein
MNLEFYNQIKNSSAHTKSREDNANFALQNLNLIPELIAFSFNVNDKSHIQAAAILDKVFELQFGLIYEYKDLVLKDLNQLKNDSAIRAISRIVMNLVQDNSKKIITNSNYLTQNQLEKITEVCFDWLIANYRVAVKQHAIYMLFEIGKTQDWIYPELQIILEKDSVGSSPAYKSIAKRILREIN